MSTLDLAACTPVNDLWPALVEALGLERSARAARQAFDLQAMHGQASTLPVLIVETCGVALVEREVLRLSTGLPAPLGEGVLLLCSQRQLKLQLLQLQLP
jgi:hypothetical protein